MANPEQYDARIKRILSKINTAKEAGIGGAPNLCTSPMAEADAAAFEKKHGIRLPEDYRRFITTVSTSASRPCYALEALEKKGGEEQLPDLSKPFTYTLDHPLIMLYLTEEEMDNLPENDEGGGFIPLCDEGCGMYSILIVNSNDPDTYGTVWFFDYANDFGTAPMRDEQTGEPFHFLDWLEYWTDHADDDFQFMETIQMPNPPDNPEILGRKMGWLD